VQLDQESFPLERDLPDLGPRERVDLGVILENYDAHVGHRQIQRDILVVLGRVHLDPVQLAPPRRLQQVQIRLGRRLPPANPTLTAPDRTHPRNSRVLLVVLHDLALHLLVLLRDELVARQVSVVGVVLRNVVPALRLHDVARHQSCRVFVALHQPLRQVPLHLEAEQVPRELLLELARIWGVEFDAEVEQGVDQRQTQLSRDGFLQVQPVPRPPRVRVLQPEIIRFQQMELLADLIEEDAARSFGLQFDRNEPQLLIFSST
jgi:hypothetical protein